MLEIPLRVLIVDDRDADIRLILDEMKSAGFVPEVCRADTEAEFLSSLAAGPDVILCDYELPRFSVQRAFELLRETESEVPLLIVSGPVGEEKAVDAIKRGAADFVRKDRLARLGPAIAQALTQRRSQKPIGSKQTFSHFISQLTVHEEAQLRASEERFRLLADASPVLIWLAGVDSRCIWLNRGLQDFLGRGLDEVCEAGFVESIHPEDQALVREAHAKAFDARVRFRAEYRVRRHDGVYRWLSETAVPTFNTFGAFAGYICCADDITERRQAEEELHRSQSILTQAGHLARLGAWQIELDSQDLITDPLWWSDEVYRLFGYEPGSIVPTNALFYEHVHPEDREQITAAMQQSLAASTPYWIEHRIIRADGAERVLAERAEVCRDPVSKRRRIVGAVQDVTEQKRVEAIDAARSHVLKLIASGSPLADVLQEICQQVEQEARDSLCSILVLDRSGVRLRSGAAPSLPAEYYAAVDGIAIGPQVGSCGTAAYRRATVAVADIATDPLWADYRGLALSYGLRACWSVPICSHAGQVLGTFAVYHRSANPDTSRLGEIVNPAAHLAGIAIERENALRAISESEQRYRDLVELAPDCVAILQHGRIVYVNREVARLIGAESAGQLLGSMLSDFLHPDDLRMSINRVRDVLETGRNVPLQKFRLRRLDGTWIVVESCAGPCRHNDEPAVQIIARDVSMQARAEEALLLRDRAIQAISEGILITDPNLPDNPVIYVNRGFERVTGYNWAEAINRNCRFLQGPGTDPADIAKLNDAIQSRASCHLELRNYRKDGKPFWNALRFDPIIDANGRVTHFVGVISDVTERRLLEEQFQQSQKMEAFGQLAGGVAHDFNNLLTVINGFSEILLSEIPADDSRHGLVAEILKAGERAAALTAQLLAFSRRTILKPKILDLNQVIENLSKMLRRLIGEDIDFVTELDPELSKVKLDPSHVEQALMNLVVNARDAMPRGGRLTIETANVTLDPDDLARYPDCQPGAHVRLAVSDTGHGMSDEVKGRAFEPFFTTKELGKGTGLGLATVYGIAKQAGGHIQIQSEVGCGTTFELLFPAISVPAEPIRKYAPMSGRGRETILLVEDEVAVRRFARVALEGQGYQVLEADSGSSALQVAESHAGTIHLLVTDIVMPGMGGRNLADALRARRPELRVLFMSGYTDDDLVRRGATDPTDDFLQKPFTPLTFARKVRTVLDAVL